MQFKYPSFAFGTNGATGSMSFWTYIYLEIEFYFCKYVPEVNKGSGRIEEIVYICLGISGT